MSGLALAELLRAGLLFLLGLDIPPLITALVFQLPNSRRAPALAPRSGKPLRHARARACGRSPRRTG